MISFICFTPIKKAIIMPVSKKCELCTKDYLCRNDKSNTSRFCSRLCTSKNAGIVCNKNRQERWNNDSPEQVHTKMKTSFETFFNKTDGCWLWKKRNGLMLMDYGNFTFRGLSYKSNRAAWTIYNGPIPEGKYVLHKCDVRNCVNPSHLFLGTHHDNMKDMRAKKRHKPRAKLTVAQVNEIRKLLSIGVSTVKISKQYNVSTTCIWYIRHAKSWQTEAA